MIQVFYIQGQIISLRAAACEYNFLRAAIDHLRYGLAGFFQNRFGMTANAVDRGWIAAPLHHTDHFIYDFWPDGGCRIMVKIDHASWQYLIWRLF